MKELAVIAAFAPLVGAIVAGLGGRWVTRTGAHSVTIFSVLLSFLASCVVMYHVLRGETFNATVYTWLTTPDFRFQIGFLIDRLTALMMVVVTNNYLQLFFGWEAVGLVSYLLIGFWYTRESAIYANLKAFLVNRVGDFGFILGVALILAYFGTLDYATVFASAAKSEAPMTLICLLLFVGAMGKSAQFP